jgi:hypothetical protein
MKETMKETTLKVWVNSVKEGNLVEVLDEWRGRRKPG